MLYLDDIQHTHPELLQKFISLCDAQRRIEGVWNGRDAHLRPARQEVLRGAWPATRTPRSGERFQIPDMLANRADTYNLGDILGGKEELFALSYLENALTSNPVLAPLATRDPADVHKLVRMAQGEEVPDQRARARLLGGGAGGDRSRCCSSCSACSDVLLQGEPAVHRLGRAGRRASAPSRRSSCRAATAT